MRVFVAINIPERIKKELVRVQDLFRGSDIPVRWVRPEGLHITLKFLGEVEEKGMRDVVRVMEEAAQGATRFTLELTEVGAFPNAQYPRIIWMGIADASGELQRIQQRIESGFEELDFEPEGRDYTPHLTLGRVVTSRARGQLIRILHAEKKQHGGAFEVTAVDLMQSTLLPTGAEYALLESILLQSPQGPEGLTVERS